MGRSVGEVRSRQLDGGLQSLKVAFGDRVYLRTRLTLISPEWTASEAAEGGLTVYQLPATPVVLLSHQGRTVSASLTED